MNVTALRERIDLGDGHQWVQPELHIETADDYHEEVGCCQGIQLVNVNTQMVLWEKEKEREEEWRRKRNGEGKGREGGFDFNQTSEGNFYF